MEDKDIKKIIDNIKENANLNVNGESNYDEQILKIEEEVFFSNIDDIDNDIKENIKVNVYDKLDKEESTVTNMNIKKYYQIKNNKKYNYSKIAGIIVILSVTLLIGAPVVMATINNFYNYIPSTGSVVKSEGKVYIIENKIDENIKGIDINIECFTIDTGSNSILVKIEGKSQVNLSDKERERLLELFERATINIGGTTLKSSDLGEGWGDKEFTSTNEFNGDFEYIQGDKITYTIYFDDNIQKDFDIKVKEAKTIDDYSKLGPSDKKEGILITAMIEEKDNILDVTFLNRTEISNGDIMSYGKEFVNEYETGVTLKDSTGKVVDGKLIFHNDRSNHFEFDTTNLIKPYIINIPQVNISAYGVIKESEKIKIKLPKEGILEFNKKVKLKHDNDKIVESNDLVNIKSIEKTNNNEYNIELDFPNNRNSKIKIRSISLDATRKLFGRDFTGYGSVISEEGIMENASIEPESSIKKSIEFVIHPNEYIIEGNWNIEIK